jgi:hypothetical protein
MPDVPPNAAVPTLLFQVAFNSAEQKKINMKADKNFRS